MSEDIYWAEVEAGANGPSVSNEEDLLQDEFGLANDDGIYAPAVEE